MSTSVSSDEKLPIEHQLTSVGSLEAPTIIEPVYPDGGLQAWATVLGAFLVQICTFGNTASFGVYQDFYVRSYIKNESPSAISWVGSFNAFLVVAGGILSGKLYDRGYFYPLLWGGSLITIVSLFLHSFAQPDRYYQIFLAQGLGTGLGGALAYVPSLAVLSQYFCKRRSLAMSIATIGASVGAIVHPILLNNLLSNPHIGFKNSVRAGAGLQAGLLLLACLLMRSKTFVMDAKSPEMSTMKQLKKLCADGPFIAATLGFGIFSVGWYFPQFYIQLDATAHGVSQTISFYSLVIMNICGVFGRILPGILATTLGVGNMMFVATASSTVLIFGMLGLKDAVGVILISVLYGFFSGTFGALSSPLVSTLTSDVSELGLRIGIAFFFCGVGGLVGPPISGALLTNSLIWWRPVLFSGFTALLGTFLFGIMLWLCKRKGKGTNYDNTSQAATPVESLKV